MKTKILVLAGSPNKEGNSALLGKWFIENIDKETYDITWIYLYDLSIPHFTNAGYNVAQTKSKADADTRQLMKLIESHEHIVVTTPIWNFSLPASVKSIIDRALYSGRRYSQEKKRAVPSWGDKKFYFIFTMGAKWYQAFINYLGILQIIFTLWYYGAKTKILGCAYNCGNGTKCVVDSRTHLQKKFNKKGTRIFS